MSQDTTPEKNPDSVTEIALWRAVYSDDTWLWQKSEDGTENRYEDIDRSKLVRFEIWLGDKLWLAIRIKSPRQQLIYRRRVEIKPGAKYRTVVIICGYRYEVSGKPVQSIFVIHPIGTIETAGSWDESDPWFYAPNIHEEEQLGSDITK